MRIFVLAAFSLISLGVLAQTSQPVLDKAEFICKTVLNLKSFSYEDHFAEGFRQQIPEAYFKSLTADIVEATGTCETSVPVSTAASGGSFEFVSLTSRLAKIRFSIDSDELINGFLIEGVSFPDIVINSWDDFEAVAAQQSGALSATLEVFGGSKENYQGDLMQPLGSGFKLYVLGELADSVAKGNFSWSDSFPINNGWKSLPSGVMHTWDEGAMVSLYDYAEYMMKISDNTATDHLIYLLGRDSVESQLVEMGNDFVSLNTPFLTTAEMFKIKWAAPVSTIDSYVLGDSYVRSQILNDEISNIPLNKVGTNGVSMSSPSFIDTIEWFGSTDSLCRAMSSLKDKSSSEVLKALSQNVPNVDLSSSSHWEYGGYKGGSEPGVLTMTYLLKSKSGQWGCLSLAWHNTEDTISTWVMSDLVGKALALAEEHIN